MVKSVRVIDRSGWDRLSVKQRAVAKAREAIMERYFDLRTGRGSAKAARLECALLAGVSPTTISSWQEWLYGVPREDWVFALAPKPQQPEPHQADCHPSAWNQLKESFLKPNGKSFSHCYRTMMDEARMHGWTPVPTERTLRRRMDREHADANIVRLHFIEHPNLKPI